MMIRDQERGYSSAGDKYVCSDCCYDEALKEFVRDNAVALECDYCKKKGDTEIAIPIDDLIGHIAESLNTEYDMPENELPTEFMKEGIGTIDLGDLLFWNHPVVDPCEGPLWDDIFGAIFSQQSWWCKRDYFGMTGDEIRVATWEEFVRLVTHKCRYLFKEMKRKKTGSYLDDECDPGTLLDTLGTDIKNLDLIKELPAGTKLFRVRLDESKKYSDLKDVGTPPTTNAKYANRMSPAGIAMFYAGEDADTAIAETWLPNKTAIASIGEFVLKKPCRILDLFDIPGVPSIYNDKLRHLRPVLMFMHRFTHDLAKPVKKDGREHIEYVPSQVVTEYFRHIFRTDADECIQGICYTSASRPGSKSYVLFWAHGQDRYTNPDLLSSWCDLIGVQHKELKRSVEEMKKRAKIRLDYKKVDRLFRRR